MSSKIFERPIARFLYQRMLDPQLLMQVLVGPRQVGKTTMAKSFFDAFDGPKLFLSADDPGLSGSQDLNELWLNLSAQTKNSKTQGLLVIDEIHKYNHWEKTVKARWDADTRNNNKLKVLILGSAPLLIQKGLSESLAGRFELIEVPHWSYDEIHQAFGLTLDEYIYFGAYPGSVPLMDDETRWKAYIKNSLIETTIGRDVMLLTRIDKPALLRQLFYLSCEYSGQVLSYQKMLGQLQDAGNTTTLAHYLELLNAVGFVCGLSKFTGSKVLSRSSSPKLQVYNTALMTALSSEHFAALKNKPEIWGRWVESAVGSHLLNAAVGSQYTVEYWKEGLYEIDFVLRLGKKTVAIEVKSGKKKEAQPGLGQFRKKYDLHRSFIVGPHGLPLTEFFAMKIADFF